jgi:hypothetical protein
MQESMRTHRKGGRMKNEDLYVYKKSDFYEDYISSQKEYYERENADAYFAEKLAEKDKEIGELKAKLEDAKASHYSEMVDAGMRERKMKRALWLARADRAKTEYNHWILIWHCELNNHLFFINKTRYKHRAKVDRLHYPWEWRDIWDEVERKCRAKAEEYR